MKPEQMPYLLRRRDIKMDREVFTTILEFKTRKAAFNNGEKFNHFERVEWNKNVNFQVWERIPNKDGSPSFKYNKYVWKDNKFVLQDESTKNKGR